jgi:ubiquinone/menaquinone biosynthesis C-methylase UbiE
MNAELKSGARDSEVRDKVASGYDDWSGTYESVENRTRDLAALALRRQVLNLPDRDVLEIGCGTGLNTRYLAEHCRCVVALDFSAGMLEQARANVSASNVLFVENDLSQRWSVDDSSIDLIVCALVLEHIEDLRHIFSEVRRVLRPGGEFLIYELHPFRQLQGGQAQFKRTDSSETVLIPAYLHSVSDYVNTGLECGFNLLRIEELPDENREVKTGIPRILSLHLRAPQAK